MTLGAAPRTGSPLARLVRDGRGTSRGRQQGRAKPDAPGPKIIKAAGMLVPDVKGCDRTEGAHGCRIYMCCTPRESMRIGAGPQVPLDEASQR